MKLNIIFLNGLHEEILLKITAIFLDTFIYDWINKIIVKFPTLFEYNKNLHNFFSSGILYLKYFYKNHFKLTLFNFLNGILVEINALHKYFFIGSPKERIIAVKSQTHSSRLIIMWHRCSNYCSSTWKMFLF